MPKELLDFTKPRTSVLRSSGMLRKVQWQLFTEDSGQPIVPDFSGQDIQDFLTTEDGTDRLSRNVGK